MIKIFRKIRQRLLSENKYNRYVFYAIGEIILVVIGILIAVQINVWRTQEALSKSNKVYLAKIIEELKLNKERLDYLAFEGDENSNLPSLKEAVENCDSIIKLTVRGLTPTDLGFVLSAKIYSGGSQLNLFDATYEELLNTGKLYTLGSDKIISSIKKYYKRYEREIEYNRRWTTFSLDGLKMTQMTIAKLGLDINGEPETFNLNDYPWYFKPNSKEYINYQIGLTRLSGGQAHDLRKCIELHKETDALIAILEKELREHYK